MTSTTSRRTTSTSSARPKSPSRPTTPTRSSTPTRCRSATPASAPAIVARPAPTARTPAASSGCTGSTRSRCSSSPRLEESYAEHERILAWERQWLDALELPVPGHRRRGRRPRALGRSQVRLRGLDPDPGALPRGVLRLQLHPVPGSPPRHPHPSTTTGPPTPVATLNGTLCAMTAHDHRAARERPAGRRLSVRLASAVPALPAPRRGAGADRVTFVPEAGGTRRRRHAGRRDQRSDQSGRARGRAAPWPMPVSRSSSPPGAAMPGTMEVVDRLGSPGRHRGHEQRRDRHLVPPGRGAAQRHLRRLRGGAPRARAQSPTRWSRSRRSGSATASTSPSPRAR